MAKHVTSFSNTNVFGKTKYGYTLQVASAPAATGTAWVHDGKMYVKGGVEYTFRLTCTEADKWYIGIQPTKVDGVTLDYDKRNGSRDGAGPNSTYIYITKTFTNAGTHVIAKAFYYEGDDFSYTDMETVDIEVNLIDANKLTITEALHPSNTTNDLTQADQTNMLYVCQTSNDTATVGLDFTWKPEGVSSNRFYWEILTLAYGPAPEWNEQKSNFAANPATNLVWTLPTSSTTNREFLIRAWYDCDEDSVYTNTEPHRIVHVTVVRLDVTIDCIAETNEETVGAMLVFEPDGTNNVWTTAGSNSLKAVSIKCWPENLPTNEIIKIEVPEGFLYEKIGMDYTLAQTFYKANEINKKHFFLHGHQRSNGLRDKTITVTHETSKAKDMAKFTVFDVLKQAGPFNISLAGKGCYAQFRQIGVNITFQLQPYSETIKVKWMANGFPGEGTKIRWSSAFSLTGHPEIGSGGAPTLYVTYAKNENDPDDKMPPDNRWFGKKELVVSIGDALVINRYVTYGFDSNSESKILNNEKVAAWYYYYVRENAVTNGLSDFNYRETLGSSGTDNGWYWRGELYIEPVPRWPFFCERLFLARTLGHDKVKDFARRRF